MTSSQTSENPQKAENTLSRPALYGLLLSILMVTLPHAIHLPLWVDALCVAFLVWRAYLTYAGNILPARWLLITITFALILGVLIEFRTIFGREVGVTILILLSTLKFLELRNLRDAMVLIYLACFIIITILLYSQSIPTALFMLATLVVVITTWVNLNAPTISFRSRTRIASTLLLQAIPLTLVLFVLFPRIHGPLWGLPQDAYASSGLDDKMAPGSLSRLSLSDEVAFRVYYSGKPPRRDQMYWRGPVLWFFDGRVWKPGRTSFTVPPEFTETRESISYSITLEPHNKNWLFTLDMPEHISIPARLTYDFQVINQDRVKSRIRYEARSNLVYHANLREADKQIERGLQLPTGFNPQARKLAADWRAQAEAKPTGMAVDEVVVRTALAYFNKQGFQYTLEPPPLGVNQVDDFLFNTRQGFCEHYASAFVVLMRAAHIPAHVVTGYQGGELNDIGNYFIVRQSDAHAWAEVWLDGRGWVRIDPTAAIAPGRIERSMASSVVNNANLSFMSRDPPQWLRDLRMSFDSIAFQWNYWVLGYNDELQFAFLTRLGMESITLEKMALNMITGIALLVLLFAGFMLRHLFQKQDKVQASWKKITRKLEKIGLPHAAHEGAQDYARRIAEVRPDIADEIQELAARYNALRYESPSDNLQKEAFQRLAAKFKPKNLT